MKIKHLFALPVLAVFIISGVSLAHAQSDIFTQNLYYGLRNNSQVSQLQEFLTSQNLYSGPTTGNFYFLTLGAVKAFQAQQGISPAAGYFGPMTMAAANKIADAEVGASNAQAINETGTSTPSLTPASSTPQLQLQALLQEVALLQQQLQTQQSSTQVIQNLQTQVQQQTQTIQQQGQTLQQIASNTQSIASTTPQPSRTQAPTANFTVNGSANSITIPYNASATISWSTTNANSCNVTPSGWSGISGNQSTGNLTASQTFTLSCSGAGGSTSASVTVNVSATPSASAITVTSDGSQPSAGQLAMGSLGNVLAVFRFMATTNIENVKVAQLTVHDAVSTGAAQFKNLTLWNGSTLLGSANAATGTMDYTFQIQGNPIVVPQSKGVSITLKGDAVPYGAGTTDNQDNTFSIQSGSITASGQSSGVPAAVTLSNSSGNIQTLLRTVLTPSNNNGQYTDGSYFIPYGGGGRRVADDVEELKFSASNSGGAVLTHLMITFSGPLASSTNFLSGVQLLDSSSNNVTSDGATEAMSSPCAGPGTSCTVTWTFPTTMAQAQISAGSTGLFKLRINDMDGIPAQNGVAPGLSVVIPNEGDIQYYDALDGSGSLISNIPSSILPLAASVMIETGN